MLNFLQTATAHQEVEAALSVEAPLQLQCPSCARPLDSGGLPDSTLSLTCPSCGLILTNREGIWAAIIPERLARYRKFIEEYETVRRVEGRGSGERHYYLALPLKDVTGRNGWQWRIRGASYRFIMQRIMPVLEYRIPVGLDILDIGAGNCWLSYRLALRGHRPVAVDLLVNQLDGLGAARHYFPFLPRRFPRFQAEMDRLPFASGQFDLAVFNASFHYSEDYRRTLGECLRCLKRPGHLLIIDSPSYDDPQSGEAMVIERREAFQEKYGFRSDSIPSLEYLTPSALSDLAQCHGIAWTVLNPWYGLKWAMRPVRARLFHRREPAKFRILWGTVE